jgi:hypothetical protein
VLKSRKTTALASGPAFRAHPVSHASGTLACSMCELDYASFGVT